MFDVAGRQKSDKYEEQGVEDEEGLRKVIESEDEEEENKKEDEGNKVVQSNLAIKTTLRTL